MVLNRSLDSKLPQREHHALANYHRQVLQRLFPKMNEWGPQAHGFQVSIPKLFLEDLGGGHSFGTTVQALLISMILSSSWAGGIAALNEAGRWQSATAMMEAFYISALQKLVSKDLGKFVLFMVAWWLICVFLAHVCVVYNIVNHILGYFR